MLALAKLPIGKVAQVLPCVWAKSRNRATAPEEITVAGERKFEVGRDAARAAALAEIRALSRPLPPGFKFDRDEANER